jgi:hypothetical protein
MSNRRWTPAILPLDVAALGSVIPAVPPAAEDVR